LKPAIVLRLVLAHDALPNKVVAHHLPLTDRVLPAPEEAAVLVADDALDRRAPRLEERLELPDRVCGEARGARHVARRRLEVEALAGELQLDPLVEGLHRLVHLLCEGLQGCLEGADLRRLRLAPLGGVLAPQERRLVHLEHLRLEAGKDVGRQLSRKELGTVTAVKIWDALGARRSKKVERLRPDALIATEGREELRVARAGERLALLQCRGEGRASNRGVITVTPRQYAECTRTGVTTLRG
jgi:hypothetical protein